MGQLPDSSKSMGHAHCCRAIGVRMAFCVKLDLGRLRDRLSVEQGRSMSLADVHGWLTALGFKLLGDWHCDGEELEHLRPDEIIAQRNTETIDHVTYSEPAPPNKP
jgi:hypothetical protein